MLKRDNLYTEEEALSRLMSGIRKIADAVGATMGTGGSNAIIEMIENPQHITSNDGWTIANSILLADPLEDMGRKILLESINRANKASGDGSSTTCVLTAAIIEEGIKYLPEAHSMEIKRQLEDCIPLIEARIKSQTRQIIDENGTLDFTALENVATISSEDPQIGAKIAEIYTKIGNSGIIHWDISKTAEDSYTLGSGITIEGATYFSAYMCDADEKGQSTNEIRIKNPYILVTKQKFSTAGDLNGVAATLNAQEIKDLIVFADDIDPLVVPDLIKTRMLRGFRIAVVKMPVLWKDQWFEDLAKTTGARVVDPAAGLAMKDVMLTDLGRCGNILITKDSAFLDGIKDMSDHIADLNKMVDDDSKLRASRLNTKTARYFVGAHSDSALSHRRLKVEDAISAAWQALNGGIVAGGGSALASIELPDTIGGNILTQAFKEPARRIASNAGYPEMVIGNDYKNGRGYDTKTAQFCDMFEAGIIDPANIVLNAAKNAVSVAAAIITAKTVVTLPRMEEPQQSSLNAVLR